ncbi:Crp/Fnr family transcriptional regulator [Paenibacillus sp. GCM10023248]|uniref:Crp/Fnr family transcriptional regulator n=1 Tax=Bacillales TaxID=1385 RepID=UPI002377F4E4|nr:MULTISPECIES: Crp/Fnr family transcriptional regulator [Bacillales]MDD9270986.1 Crp/Fnr family transcriptional regulator [Paenibacillus sp. MAHUQ-63]MDR6882877.1 CRP-like cAMP-binding protein [Bacillus sp. 3255]
MKLHKGETLFRQGETGGLFRLKSGLLKIVRVHEDGHATLVNIIVPDETIPHHSLISPKPYHGTAVALVSCEVETIPAEAWYRDLEMNPEKFRVIAQQLQDKLRMMQQRIDQLAEVTPAGKLKKLENWVRTYLGDTVLTDILTQEEIGQLVGLRRETVNRLLREQSLNL